MADPPRKPLSFKLGGGVSKKATAAQSSPLAGAKRPLAALQAHHRRDDEAPAPQAITHYDSSAGGAYHEADKPDNTPRIIPVKKRHRMYPDGRSSSYAPTAKEHEALIHKVQKIDEDKADRPEGLIIRDNSADPTIQPGAVEPAARASAIPRAVSDEAAFRRDYDEAPPPPVEADYDAVPVEGFGAALLRGMGWKDGEAIGLNKNAPIPKIKVRERRPNLLGVDAKPAQAVGFEMGSWKSTAKNETSYNPVAVRDTTTGEVITPQEYEARMAEELKTKQEKLAKYVSNTVIKEEWKHSSNPLMVAHYHHVSARVAEAQRHLLECSAAVALTHLEYSPLTEMEATEEGMSISNDDDTLTAYTDAPPGTDQHKLDSISSDSNSPMPGPDAAPPTDKDEIISISSDSDTDSSVDDAISLLIHDSDLESESTDNWLLRSPSRHSESTHDSRSRNRHDNDYRRRDDRRRDEPDHRSKYRDRDDRGGRKRGRSRSRSPDSRHRRDHSIESYEDERDSYYDEDRAEARRRRRSIQDLETEYQSDKVVQAEIKLEAIRDEYYRHAANTARWARMFDKKTKERGSDELNRLEEYYGEIPFDEYCRRSDRRKYLDDYLWKDEKILREKTEELRKLKKLFQRAGKAVGIARAKRWSQDVETERNGGPAARPFFGKAAIHDPKGYKWGATRIRGKPVHDTYRPDQHKDDDLWGDGMMHIQKLRLKADWKEVQKKRTGVGEKKGRKGKTYPRHLAGPLNYRGPLSPGAKTRVQWGWTEPTPESSY